jgi:hypothetical protein
MRVVIFFDETTSDSAGCFLLASSRYSSNTMSPSDEGHCPLLHFHCDQKIFSVRLRVSVVDVVL